ncbi:MAG: response regulator transcription factor [Kangiellaceae bacterium]|nr:response regulator transcription factor [Kangiellaceae bacterium]
MNKFQCLIIDDEELARELLQSYLEQLPQFELVAACASAIQANEILKNTCVDLMFLDIEMPILKGMDFYKNLNNKPKVIFTTAYRDYAIEGFEQEAVDYLLKPITFARFFKATEKFLALKQVSPSNRTQTEDYLFVRENRKQIKINLHDILYIQSLKDYIQIHLTDGKHIVKHSISSFQAKLTDSFIRVHRSYIVNLDKINAYSATDIEIGDLEIPIGENYRKQLTQRLQSKSE